MFGHVEARCFKKRQPPKQKWVVKEPKLKGVMVEGEVGIVGEANVTGKLAEMQAEVHCFEVGLSGKDASPSVTNVSTNRRVITSRTLMAMGAFRLCRI